MNKPLTYQLKRLREERKLTQDDLAKAIGLSRSAITKYETGEREPDLETCKKLASFFNITLDELLNIGEGSQKNLSDLIDKSSLSSGKGVLKEISNGVFELEFSGILRPENVELLQKIDKLSGEQRKLVEMMVEQFLTREGE